MKATMTIGMMKSAVLSECGRYRYSLTRRWELAKPVLVVVMLNPSTADASQDDPTIRKVMGFARARNYGGITVVNLFAWRSTDPNQLPGDEAMAVGEINDVTIRTVAEGRTVLCAWGNDGVKLGRDKKVLAMLNRLGCQVVCLGTTKGGHPRHPLYVSYETRFANFRR